MKNRAKSLHFLLIFVTLILVACISGSEPANGLFIGTAEVNDMNLPNPVMDYCLQKGYRWESRPNKHASQAGVCIFPSGSGCDGWLYYRGECGPITSFTPLPMSENKALEAAKNELARQLNLDTRQVIIFSLEQIQWPDGCLAIPRPGELCKIEETPGFRIIFTVGENHYAYHTDLSGENIRQETAGMRGD